MNGRPINSFISREADPKNSRTSKKNIISYKVISSTSNTQINDTDKNSNEDVQMTNPFLSNYRTISRREEFSIRDKMTILAVLSPLFKSPIDFEMTSAEVNHLSAETNRIYKSKSISSQIQNFLGLKHQSFETKNSNVIFYCLAMRFLLREQLKAFLGLDHCFLQNFVVSVGLDGFFMQRMDCLGLASILCVLKNVFIYRSENKDFARDLFGVVSEALEFYWR
jgi:hypothetical protein